MRPRIPWLTRVDVATLEFLDGHALDGFEQSPALIAENLGVSAGHVRRRIRVLAAAELVERTNETTGYYAITDVGRRYLAGDLTDAEADRLRAFDPSAS